MFTQFYYVFAIVYFIVLSAFIIIHQDSLKLPKDFIITFFLLLIFFITSIFFSASIDSLMWFIRTIINVKEGSGRESDYVRDVKVGHHATMVVGTYIVLDPDLAKEIINVITTSSSQISIAAAMIGVSFAVSKAIENSSLSPILKLLIILISALGASAIFIGAIVML